MNLKTKSLRKWNNHYNYLEILELELGIDNWYS